MMYRVVRPDSDLQVSLTLPASKSISNRLLIILALAENQDDLQNLSDSDDTSLMLEALHSDATIKNVGHAGTSMRFLTAFYSIQKGKVEMRGSSRMHQRPIGPLADTLIELGAAIEYLEKDGFPPLVIEGKKIHGGPITIDSSISSQFISALLMIGPYMTKGLELKLEGKLVSASYIKMTLELMSQHGAKYTWEGDRITVAPGSYKKGTFTVESDWSAAAFWYSMALLDKNPSVVLRHLFNPSLQGDNALISIFNELGLISSCSSSLVKLEKNAVDYAQTFTYDFTSCPDLVQAISVALCLAGIPFDFKGTQTLRIKETDRILALQTELGKLGFVLDSNTDGSFLAWRGERCEEEEYPVISTYHDHRMAMAFAPVALLRSEIIIDDPMVVTKSYPRFWEDLRSAGFSVDVV